MASWRWAAIVIGLAGGALVCAGPQVLKAPPVDLTATITPSALHDLGRGPVRIAARVTDGADAVRVRVTTSAGAQHERKIKVIDQEAQARYPADFEGASALAPGMLFIDATTADRFDGHNAQQFQAEIAVVVYDRAGKRLPDFPSAFTNDLFDAQGRVDRAATEWPTVRTLVNLWARSRAARLVERGSPDFDLARDADLAYYRDNLALYDFTHRDRDWSTPLNARVARTYWQAVWPTWFNASNNNPLDGNDANSNPGNYRPYCFANDFADILIVYLMRREAVNVLDDNLEALCREGLENLLAMQHRTADNFARPDRSGRTHTYTAGAFRYGLFENGEFLTEGKGWFYNPAHSDYIHGGVFNGRATWALGEGLKRFPDGALGKRLREAVAASVRYCLVDALEHGYAKRSAKGHVYWQDHGEQGYLLLGMLAACEADPNLVIVDAPKRRVLREFCAESLSALVDLQQPHGQWNIYQDKDNMASAALAYGAHLLAQHPDAARWKAAAIAALDGWTRARVDPREYPGEVVHVGLRLKPEEMTFRWGFDEQFRGGRNFLFFYQSGHFTHALARGYQLTGDARYRDRAERMIRYLCGANPFHVRILSELGGVYNWVEDKDGDGLEDELKMDMYPESTAFTQIGITHLLHACCERGGR